MIQWKLDCRSQKQKWKNQPITRPGIEHCDWFILLLLLATPTMQFSLDRKRWSHKRMQCSASDSVGLIFTGAYHSTFLIMTTTPSLVKTSLKKIFAKNAHFYELPLMQDIKMLLRTLRKDRPKHFLDVPLDWLLVCLFWPCEQESLIRQFCNGNL